jgi:hypothetical protein
MAMSNGENDMLYALVIDFGGVYISYICPSDFPALYN